METTADMEEWLRELIKDKDKQISNLKKQLSRQEIVAEGEITEDAIFHFQLQSKAWLRGNIGKHIKIIIEEQ